MSKTLLAEAAHAGQVFKWCGGYGCGFRQRWRCRWSAMVAALPEGQRERVALALLQAWIATAGPAAFGYLIQCPGPAFPRESDVSGKLL